eukprot:jgi/Psemu1/295018/fgenesh1_pm.41_\
MSTKIRSCPDGHRCENGSSCAQHPIDEGKYYCDCGTSVGDFAGLFCEYEADNYCQLQEETTSNWFCTNGGTCVLSTGKTPEAQWDCDCPANYDGPHCQFVSGNVPKDWPGYDLDPATGLMVTESHSKRRGGGNGGGGGIHFGIYIFIGLVVAAILALVGFFVLRKVHNSGSGGGGSRENGDPRQNSTRDHSEAVNKLEADGSVLQEIMASFARTPNSTIKQDHQNHHEFDAASLNNRSSSDDTSVEVGFYSDKPRQNGSSSRAGASRDIL